MELCCVGVPWNPIAAGADFRGRFPFGLVAAGLGEDATD
jgi:hypothetical protein